MGKTKGRKISKTAAGKMFERMLAEMACTGSCKCRQHLEVIERRLPDTSASGYDKTKFKGHPTVTLFLDPWSTAVVRYSVLLNE